MARGYALHHFNAHSGGGRGTREPLYSVDTAAMFADAASSLGLTVQELIEVELDRAIATPARVLSTLTARPSSCCAPNPPPL